MRSKKQLYGKSVAARLAPNVTRGAPKVLNSASINPNPTVGKGPIEEEPSLLYFRGCNLFFRYYLRGNRGPEPKVGWSYVHIRNR